MTLPLIVLLIALLAYPMGFAVYISMLDRGMTRFVGLHNFALLIDRPIFWQVVFQTTLFAITAVLVKTPLGFAMACLMHNIPAGAQRWWRGLLLVPWVIPPVMSTIAWRLLFDPVFSAVNWLFERIGLGHVSWLADTGWARFSVILVSVWFGAPFFMIMFLASMKSVPDELYEAALIDGATAWQRLRYVTLPLMRRVIAITMLFSLIGGFTGFTVVEVLTTGGPLRTTSVLATAAFLVGIGAGHLPLGAAVSLFMLPPLALAAIFILRGIARRGSDV
jgi:multiple sugar transport system permease protein